MTTWSPEQERALKAVSAWLRQRNAPQVFRLFGYAGTGKTTLARELAESVDGTVLFGAFTGKAALVLRQKGCAGAATIHSLIYRLETQDFASNPIFSLNPESPVATADLVIIDEVSMVGEDLGRDLMSFGTKILVLGDPAQLPPVKGQGFFTNAEPDLMLTEVHRQAADSPIVRLATSIRQGERITEQDVANCNVVRREAIGKERMAEIVLAADQVLVGRNRTRHGFNARIRELKGFAGPRPMIGEKIICLRNDRIKKLLNGSMWTVKDTLKRNKAAREKNAWRFEILPEGVAADDREGLKVMVRDEFWAGTDDELSFEDKRGCDDFAYGYGITVHKAQGSQWDRVLVFDESNAFPDTRERWLYTAITRAAKQLTVVMS